jgi:hypothetical protein
MKRHLAMMAAMAWLCLAAAAMAQQEPPTAEPPTRVEAKKDVVVSWTLGEQAWNFKDILTAYEPVKGYLEPRGSQGVLAVWKLRLVKDFEAGASRLHEETRGSPFKIVLFDADQTVIDADLPAQITTISGKMGDTIELLVGLPEAQKLKDAKMIRVQRRTNVGF